MTLLLGILYLLVHVLVLAVLARFVLEMIESFSRGWRPQGAVLVLASAVYAVTDVLVRPLRRVMPPLRMGGIALDLSAMVLILGLSILEGVLRSLFLTS